MDRNRGQHAWLPLPKRKYERTLEHWKFKKKMGNNVFPYLKTQNLTYDWILKNNICVFAKEEACNKEIKEDDEGISGDHHANESCIEKCFQVSTRLDQFCFCFYFINLHFQHLIFHIILYSRFSFSELKDNFGLLLLDRWLH